jgi:hypothetical protein
MTDKKVDTVGPKVGRPSKRDLEATEGLSKRQQAAVMKEWRQRILLHPKSEGVIQKLFELALDDDAKNQSVALKILSDRLIPLAGFSAENKSTPSVSINITGIGSDEPAGVTIEGQYDDGDDDERP